MGRREWKQVEVQKQELKEEGIKEGVWELKGMEMWEDGTLVVEA